jgi:tetratricopeptide (TPR) repeat protein
MCANHREKHGRISLRVGTCCPSSELQPAACRLTSDARASVPSGYLHPLGRFLATAFLGMKCSVAGGGAVAGRRCFAFLRLFVCPTAEGGGKPASASAIVCRVNFSVSSGVVKRTIVSEIKEALRLKRDDPDTHYCLGNVLRDKGHLEGAIAEHRELRLKNDYAEARCNLRLALQQQGEFRSALEELRRGHELGSRDPRWHYASAAWVRRCEHLVELDERLPRIFAGKATLSSAAGRIELAWLCSLKRLHRTAARFYEEAIAADPRLADNAGAHRYNAACAAALASCREGKDAEKPDHGERARGCWARRRTASLAPAEW